MSHHLGVLAKQLKKLKSTYNGEKRTKQTFIIGYEKSFTPCNLISVSQSEKKLKKAMKNGQK